MRPLLTNRYPFTNHRVPYSFNLKKQSIQTKHSSQNRTVSTARLSSIFQLLSHDESTLLAEQRALTERAKNIAKQIPEVASNLAKKSLLPETPFSVVICGEFNAGKSTLLNALLGAHVLDTGPLPTTDCITILLHGELETVERKTHGNTLYYTSPYIPPDVVFVDTPGTNAVVLNHTLTTLDLLPSADLILFCTSADRPFSQSERDLLQQMQHYRKSIVVVINKMDILEQSGGDHGAMAKKHVVDFVTEHAADLLGAKPVVLPVSARDALSCKVNGMTETSAMYVRSQFSVLEEYLQTHLTADTKITSKLLSPIGVVQGVVTDYLELLQKQQRELQTDIATLRLLQSQCTSWRTEMKHELDAFRKDMCHVLYQEGNRAQKFLERVSMLNLFLWSLTDKSRLNMEWIKLQRPLMKELDERLQEAARLMNTRARAQGQAVVEYLGKRPVVKSQSLVGSVSARWTDSSFQTQLESAVGAEVGGRTMTSGLTFLHNRAILAAAFQVVAAAGGLATVISEMDPVMCLPLVAALSACGGVAMYNGKVSFISQHRKTWNDIRSDLDEALRVVSDKELASCNTTIMDGVAPYTRYVETEKQRLTTLTKESEDVLATAQSLRNRIIKLRT